MVKVIERKRASALPPDERRSAIIDATLPLLLEHGEMVTTRQIAEAAGIAEGTIFRVFADKDEVIAAVDRRRPRSRAARGGPRRARPDGAVRARASPQAIAILQRRIIEIWRLMSSVGPALPRPRAPAR